MSVAWPITRTGMSKLQESQQRFTIHWSEASGEAATPRWIHFFNNCAFTATTTVLKLISTAPIAGLSTKCGYNTPAAKGKE